MYIDTHVHLNADQYENDVDEVITRALMRVLRKWLS